MESVLSVIGTGAENAVNRFELVERTGLDDRKVRKEIARLRKDGVNIINNQDGRGYYVDDSTDALYRQYKQDTARALSILERRKAIRDELKRRGVDVKH